MTRFVVGLWFVAALALSASGWFARFSAPALFGAGAAISTSAFLLLHRFHTGFRAMARAADLRHLTEAQAFRFYGLLAFVEWHRGALPALFAIPTGTIDLGIAASAFWVAAHGVAGKQARPGFFLWHRAGLCGLAASVLLVLLTASPQFGLVDPAHTSQPMAEFPMSLVPTFIGPLVLVMHLLALTEASEKNLSPTRL